MARVHVSLRLNPQAVQAAKEAALRETEATGRPVRVSWVIREWMSLGKQVWDEQRKVKL